MVINLDAKMWPNAPDSDASAHYKVGCFYGNEISSFC